MFALHRKLVQGDKVITLEHQKMGLDSQKIYGYCSIKRNQNKLVSIRCNRFFGNKKELASKMAFDVY
jgi:hypothetical protein